MTELEKKAKEYADKTEFTEYDNSSLSESLDISEEIKQAYIAGAKENQPNAEEMIKRLLKGGYITTGISEEILETEDERMNELYKDRPKLAWNHFLSSLKFD